MGRNSTGVFQTKDKTWGYRIKITINGKSVDTKRVRDENGNIFRTKTDAIKARKAALFIAETELKRQGTDSIPIARKTVQEVFNEYCEKGRSDRAYNTKLKQDSLWKNHIQSTFGNKYVDEISTAEVQDFLSALYYEDEYAYRYVESFLKMFYLIFGQAYSRNYLSVEGYSRLCTNKLTKIHMPKMKSDEDLEIIAFNKEERTIIEQHFTGTNAETAYRLGRYCGLRINECFGLKWTDIDLKNGIIHLRQQMQYQNGLIKLVPLKTHNARRDIYLNQQMKQFLSDRYTAWNNASPRIWELREQNQKMITDTDGKKVSCLVLVNCLFNGKIQTVNSMKYHSRELKQKHGINFKYHFLRHTYGTLLAVMNTPTHVLCKQMGHAKIEVTEKYYIANSKEGIAILRDNLEKI